MNRDTGHKVTPAARTASWSRYEAGFADGRRHGLAGKPALASPTPYGHGFYDGWKSVRYPAWAVTTEVRVDNIRPLRPATDD